MRAVFDTNILIDYLNGIELAKIEIQQYAQKAISIITYIEVLVGINEKRKIEIIKAFLRNFLIIEVSSEIAELTIIARKEHKIKIPDAIILATAQSFKGELVTRNTKYFKKNLPFVKVPYELPVKHGH